jgi:hypothetical protein
MHGPVVILADAASPLPAIIEAEMRRLGASACVLSLTAPLEAGRVSILPDAVVWEDVDLTRAGAVLVERPLFAWSQPHGGERLIEDGVPSPRLVTAEREACSLALSAMLIASGVTRTVNPPSAAWLAVAPAMALHRLARRGLPVHRWRIEPAPEGDRLLVDSVGRDLWLDPERPPAGEPALTFDPAPGEVVSLFVIGERLVGGMRFGDATSWARREAGEPLGEQEVSPRLAEVALQVAVVLEVDIVVVSALVRADEPAILLADTAPDLAEWNIALGGRLASTLADHLIEAAAGREGVDP